MEFKPQDVINKKKNRIIAVLVFAFSLGIYLLTMARSLSFWDCGEYITCSSILGVPHPPGNPFYILLGRFFTAIVGDSISHAIVVNFMSAFFSALAVMLTYLITVKILSMWIKKEEAWLAHVIGIIAALYTAFSYSFWHNAIEAEVYGGLAFFINLIIYLTLTFIQKSEDLSHQNYLMLIIYLFFLGFGVHQTVLQIAPAVLFIALYAQLAKSWKDNKDQVLTRGVVYFVLLIVLYFIFNPLGEQYNIPDLSKMIFAIGIVIIIIYNLKEQVSTKTWILAFLLVGIAFGTHIFLLVRSAHRPFINEGHPHNWELFKAYIFRTQYGTTNFIERNAPFWHQINHSFLRYFGWQFFNADTFAAALSIPVKVLEIFFRVLVAALGFYGMHYTWKKNRHAFNYLIALFLMASVAMIFVMNQKVQEVRDRDYFFVTAYNLWAIWMALGSLGIIKSAYRKVKQYGYVALIIMLILPGLNLASQYWIHDRHKEFIALDYGLNILNSLEENAIIFTNGDNDTFPVWYAQAVYDPYSIEHVWEARNVAPTDSTRAKIKRAMAFKNSTIKGIRKDVSVANLSLLNTPWYIKQLKDREGIEFNISDEIIDRCQDTPNTLLYPRAYRKGEKITIPGNKAVDGFTVKYNEDDVFYTNDLAVRQIIRDNYGKRPIYFAVTVAEHSGFKQHLRNEGMVERLVSSVQEKFDAERLTANIDSVYSFRTIDDPSVYKDPNMLRLLNNYGAAFMRASYFYQNQLDISKSIEYMENALKFIEQKDRFYPNLSDLYMRNALDMLPLADTLNTEDKSVKLEMIRNQLVSSLQYSGMHIETCHQVYQLAISYPDLKQIVLELLLEVQKYEFPPQETDLLKQMIEDLQKE